MHEKKTKILVLIMCSDKHTVRQIKPMNKGQTSVVHLMLIL
jgi:hypothetical protein